MKKLLLLLWLFTFIYGDGLTFDNIKKCKLKFGYSDQDILAEVETAGGVKKIPGIYVKLLRLGIRENIVEQMLSIKAQTTQIPERIAKHYQKRMTTPKIKVLAVGINQYTDSETFPTLQSATLDAEDFVKELLVLGVPTNNVELLTDSSATQKNITAAVDRLAHYNETIYVFFSGHGLNIEGNFYFSCHDTQKDKITETTYAMTQLKQKLSKANCKYSVVFLDACHSGSSKNVYFNTKPKKRPSPTVQDKEPQKVSLLWDEGGRKNMGDFGKIEKPIFLMVSCGANQVSLQGQGTKNSVFTHYLLEGMRGKADKNNDKNINTLELSGYVRNKVFESTFRQKPDFSVSKGWQKEHCAKAGIYISDLADNVPDIPDVPISADELAWIEKQEKMQKSFDYLMAKVDERRISSKSKIRYWNKFLKMYKNFSNPHSEADENLKKKAQERIAYWKKKSDTRRLVRLEVTPENTSCQKRGSLHFTVKGIRANGERYTPQVSWKAQYGKIDSNGWYTAPNRKGGDKVMAVAKENSRVKKVAYVTLKGEELARLEIIPSSAKLKLGEKVQFRVSGYNSSGQRMSNLNNLSWSKSGGDLDWNNNYTAGSTPGNYSVVVRSSNGISTQARIEIERKATSMPGFTFLQEKTYSCGGQTHRVKEYRHDRTGMEFVLIPGGSFRMGSDYGGSNEKPVHRVSVNSFLMAKYEVTKGMWQKVRRSTPWRGKSYVKEGDEYAATHIDWKEANSFCKKYGWRLPTEAEWEYACRAGTNNTYYWGNSMDGRYAWYKDNADSIGNEYAHKIGQKFPNAFGLYDMTGNVWEWCADWYDKNYYASSPANDPQGASSGLNRVIRGGGWDSNPRNCNSTGRYGYSPGYRYSDLGFRPCVTWTAGN